MGNWYLVLLNELLETGLRHIGWCSHHL